MQVVQGIAAKRRYARKKSNAKKPVARETVSAGPLKILAESSGGTQVNLVKGFHQRMNY
jgi:hypothetical protein